ncbi:MAG TPA: DUF983 domain-containing protein [Bacteroidia bacterium]|nr:DUF983 domain-containing protein [Bacteroidia bacterium]
MRLHETRLYSILANKCPRCHKGNFFETGNPYDLKRFTKMNSECPACKEDFNRETGFYFGAAYVSYGLTVGFGIGLYLLLCVWGNVDTASFVIIFSLLLIALLPVFFRFSRLIWINLFVHPKKN